VSRVVGLVGGVLAAAGADAADLPQDRADVMYHSYNGGGVKADGPALLVRKSIADRVSVSASYYVDMVSNASIDVVTTASPYKERRSERGAGLDYVVRDSLISWSATASREPDYRADMTNLDVAQDVFGGMTTVSVGYSRGHDVVGRHGSPSFSETADHWQYRLGVTQVLTPRWLMSANFEAVSDTGYLQSPYRAARVFGALVPEIDPNTRSSRAVALRAVGDVDAVQGAVRAEYRYFWDTWDIRAHTAELGYSRHLGPLWLADATLRYYTQRHALFYSDNFASEMTYMSRNRQLGSFNDRGIGLKASYTAVQVPARLEVKLNAACEWLRFKYSDFTDIRTGQPYAFSATVLELFASATF
jgi:hypothetical protein